MQNQKSKGEKTIQTWSFNPVTTAKNKFSKAQILKYFQKSWHGIEKNLNYLPEVLALLKILNI